MFKVGDKITLKAGESYDGRTTPGKVYAVTRLNNYQWGAIVEYTGDDGVDCATFAERFKLVEDSPEDLRIKELVAANKQLAQEVHALHIQCKTLQGKLFNIHNLSKQ